MCNSVVAEQCNGQPLKNSLQLGSQLNANPTSLKENPDQACHFKFASTPSVPTIMHQARLAVEPMIHPVIVGNMAYRQIPVNCTSMSYPAMHFYPTKPVSDSGKQINTSYYPPTLVTPYVPLAYQSTTTLQQGVACEPLQVVPMVYQPYPVMIGPIVTPFVAMKSESPNLKHYFLDSESGPKAKRLHLSSQTPEAESNEGSLENAVQILCQLHEKKQDSTVFSDTAAKQKPSSYPPVSNTPTLSPYAGRSYGHALCSYCHKRNPLRSQLPPPIMHCYCCGRIFQVYRRFLHGYRGPMDDDESWELPCLRGLTNVEERTAQLNAYVEAVLIGRRCNISAYVRDIQRMVNALVSKVDRMVTRERKHAEEECSLLMDSLLVRVEQYVRGELYCQCLQPAFPQRHFIQCDVCDLWFHTSCVNIDSRKLATISSFVCPWCLQAGPRPSNNDDVTPAEVCCVCPLCDRSFPRPCNLSRHLHAKHNMKWNTHIQLHMNVDDYLEQEKVSTTEFTPIDRPLRQICEGCFAAENSDQFEMTKSQYRFLLRKIRTKPSPWWIKQEVRIWDFKKQCLVPGFIKCIRPRSEFCIKLEDESITHIANIYDPKYRIRLLILNGCFELELYHALPTPHQHALATDLRFFS